MTGDPYFALVNVPPGGTQQLNSCQIGAAGGTCTAKIAGNQVTVTVPKGSFSNLPCDPANVVITNVNPALVSLPVKDNDVVFVFGLGILCGGVPVTQTFAPPISAAVKVVVPTSVTSNQIRIFSVGAFGGASPAVNEPWVPITSFALETQPSVDPLAFGATGGGESVGVTMPPITGDPYFTVSVAHPIGIPGATTPSSGKPFLAEALISLVLIVVGCGLLRLVARRKVPAHVAAPTRD